jgi:hypothetical protein
VYKDLKKHAYFRDMVLNKNEKEKEVGHITNRHLVNFKVVKELLKTEQDYVQALDICITSH